MRNNVFKMKLSKVFRQQQKVSRQLQKKSLVLRPGPQNYEMNLDNLLCS